MQSKLCKTKSDEGDFGQAKDAKMMKMGKEGRTTVCGLQNAMPISRWHTLATA